ncbi:MAG: hypothetical protein OEX12_14160, partial [Gammaproteobacteria bacterium]|nr:hypothetical protein [Gammaproteobacteria bacterium]
VAVGVANICSGSTTLTCTSYTGTFNDITWNGSAYVAVGDAGLIHTSTSGAHNSFGTALNTGISGVGTENIKAITTDGTIFFLVTDNITMKVFESENNSGQTWNNIVDQNFNSTGIAFMDTMLFGISTAGDVRRTSDFATTQTYNIGITQDLYSIIRINNSLFVTGNNGTVAQSILN